MTLTFVILLIVAACYHSQADDGWKYKFGGRHPVPVDDRKIVSVSKWAAEKLGGKLKKINYAEEQIVSGLMYYVDMNVDFQDFERYCSVRVWTKEWVHLIRLVYSRCKKMDD